MRLWFMEEEKGRDEGREIIEEELILINKAIKENMKLTVEKA